MKRGMHSTYMITGLVLLAIVLFVSAMVLVSLQNVYNELESDTRCTAQVRAHAASVKVTNELKAPDFVCQTERLTLTADDDAAEVIAQRMKQCWDTFGRGELQLFGTDGGIYCHVCSTLQVEEDVEGLQEYLATRRVSFSPGSPTYEEYFAGVKSGEYYERTALPDYASGSISGDKPLGVIFYYAKGQNFLDRMQNHLTQHPVGTTVAGATAGAAVGIKAGVFIGSFASPIGSLVLGSVGGLAGAVTGGALGLAAALQGSETSDTMSAIVVRSLAEEDVSALGCTFMPVANS